MPMPRRKVSSLIGKRSMRSPSPTSPGAAVCLALPMWLTPPPLVKETLGNVLTRKPPSTLLLPPHTHTPPPLHTTHHLHQAEPTKSFSVGEKLPLLTVNFKSPAFVPPFSPAKKEETKKAPPPSMMDTS